jgi:alpha(1,3/1,4) fucosyltransferase
MRKASLVVSSHYNNNKIFNLDDTQLNRDNCLYCFHSLKENLIKQNILLATSDIHSIQESEIVIYNEMPDNFDANHNPQKSYLLLFETEVIKPSNWNLTHHKNFAKIFTWHDDFIKNDFYIKMNFSHLFPNKIQRIDFEKRKSCTLISGNKSVVHPNELYSQRLFTIKWFELNHPDEFDFYGMGWNNISIKNNLFNKLLRKTNLSKLMPIKKSKCYKGKVESKVDTLKNYKFSICYENVKNTPGYITEKIFDSFFAGCIPIYWGAPNVSDYIPKNCYIDRGEFASHEDLYQYISNMTASEFNKRLDDIENYLQSESSEPFTAEYFSRTISDHVKK